MKVQALSRRETAAWLPFITLMPIALVAVFVLFSMGFEREAELATEVEASNHALTELRDLLSLHQDLEIGQRGYLLTGDEEFLTPYSNARPRIDSMLAMVEQSVGASPKLERVKTLSKSKVAFVDRTIELARSGRLREALALVRTGRGKALMNTIRGEIAMLESDKTKNLVVRERAADQWKSNVWLVAFAIFAGLCLLLAIAITISLRATRARNAATSQYRDISARQEAIFASARDGILTINPSGSIESANAAIAAMTGYEPWELLRRDIGILIEIAPDAGQQESFLRRLARQRRRGQGAIMELSGMRKDGSHFPCDVSVSKVAHDSDRVFVAIVRDTTERKRVQQLKNEFVSTVSHELRTPLTSISGSLGLLAGGAAGALPEKAGRLIQIARGNCERLVRLINDILDMEKLESGRMNMRLEPIELGPFLEQAVQVNQGFADEHDVDLELLSVTNSAVVIADRDRLIQVVTNLISNAVKFSPRGETVTIAVVPLDRRWRINVSDQGPGIAEAFRPHIFGKFAQANAADSRQIAGTGLGLSIVREIVTRLAGAVSFTSEEGVGTTFHVDLPAHNWHTRPYPSQSDAISVLHVEDDPDVIALVSDSLGGRYALDAAQTLAEARKAFSKTNYKIAILDCALPDGDGRTLIPELRAHGIPVLIFTAQDGDVELEGQVDAVLVKSRASLGTLVETIDRLLVERASGGPD